MPRLSILLPARDAESTILTAVRSTLRAMPRDAELVVLDDGSTDTTATRLGTVTDPRLRLIRGEGSGGVGPALTRLLAETDSELVGRMDADDASLPWRFAVSLAALRRGHDLVFTPSVDVVGGRRRVHLGAPVPISRRAFPYALLLSNPVRHHSLLARREVLEEVGGYRTVPSEDYDLWVRCALAGASICRTSTWGVVYREHPAQLTRAAGWRRGSHADPLLAEAFAELSQRLLGRSFPRLVSLQGRPVGERERVLAEFEEAFSGALGGLAPPDRLFLRTRLERRLRTVLGAEEVAA